MSYKIDEISIKVLFTICDINIFKINLLNSERYYKEIERERERKKKRQKNCKFYT